MNFLVNSLTFTNYFSMQFSKNDVSSSFTSSSCGSIRLASLLDSASQSSTLLLNLAMI